MRGAGALLALGAAAVVCLWNTGGAGQGGAWAGAFLWGYCLAWACYVAASSIVTRAVRLPRWVLVWIVVVAISLRVVSLARTPPLSTDVWRYLWDGRVAKAGVNPYRYAPEAPELRHLRDQSWQGINHKEIPTIYPPLAEMVFAGLVRVRDRDAQAFRWAFMLCDLGSVLVLIALLRRMGRPAERVIWYAWCPLAAVEVTAGAHVDAFGLLLLLSALLLAVRGARAGAASGAALAAAVMAKGPAVLAAPFFVRRGGWRLLVVSAAACLLLLMPYAGAGMRLLHGLKAYLGAWKVNSSVFLLINAGLARVTAQHFVITRALTTATVLAIVVWLAWRQKSGVDGLIGAVFAAFGAQLLIGAPTFPWYVIGVVPALCFWRIPGLALFTLTVSAQYYARWLFPGNEAAQRALLWAGYVPVYGLLVGQVIWSRRRRASRLAAP